MTSKRPYSAFGMARAFEMGICSRDDVATWIGERASDLEVSPDALLELTLLRHKDAPEIVRLLEQIEPPATARERALATLRMLENALDENRVTCAVAFSAIYGLKDDLCEEAQDAIIRLSDDECWHRVEDAEAAVRAFLRARSSGRA